MTYFFTSSYPDIRITKRKCHQAIYSGEKNWLFSDTPKGAEASATVYTMVEMAKAHGLNVYEYLKYLLIHRPNKEMTDEQLEELAPWSEDAINTCKKK